MSDNPTEVEATALPLPDYRLLEIAGRDAMAVAQAQFMNDVAALADGQWQWSGWLTPKGRVVALFALLRLDDRTLWLLLPDFAPVDLAAALRTYVFRSHVTMTTRDDLRVSGTRDAHGTAPGRQFFQAPDTASVSLGWPGDRGIDIRPGTDDGKDALGDPGWYQADLRTGIPRLVATQSAQWTPQQLSLERLAAYSVKKGCYPGQEIVARTHFLGQAKRGLVLLQGEVPLAPGDPVSDGTRETGQVVSASGDWALAIAPPGTHIVESRERPVREQPFEG